MKKMFTLLGAFCLCLLPHALMGQVVVKQVLIGNGGTFLNASDNAHLIRINADLSNPEVIDTIQTQSMQDILIEGVYAYVAAQDSIVKYHLPSGQRVAAAAFGAPSTIKLGLYKDYLLVGNWYGAASSNFRIFDKFTLSPVAAIPEIVQGATDFVVYEDSAFIVQNYLTPGFTDSAGYLAVVDLNSMSYVRDIHFLNNDEELGRIHLDDGIIYGFNSSSNTHTRYEIATNIGVTQAAGVDLQVGLYGSQLGPDKNTLMMKLDGGLGWWNFNLQDFADTLIIDTLVTAFALDTTSGKVYLTQTDFANFKSGAVYSLSGQKLNTFPVGSAPEVVRIAYNSLPQVLPDTFILSTAPSDTLRVLANDFDADGDSLRLTLVNQPKRGNVILHTQQLIYSPDSSFLSGLDSLQYQLTDEWGDSAWAWVYIFADQPTAISPLSRLHIQAYPNPFRDQLSINGAISGPMQLRLYDALGRLVYEEAVALPIQLSLAELPVGAYTLTLSGSDFYLSKSLWKIE